MASESLQANDRLESMRLLFNTELQLFIENEIENGAGDVAKLCGEVLLAGGKRIRPLLILLAHEIAGGVDPDEVMSLALSFELIHTATLVHDDIN
ncbi:MAG: polyprenyl synthetase family protein, partial [Candidatus Poseidoniaceae archaeon]|nr:polyprenyl synthetase family protein [Candidatus Poseidoniaceae archaeon]